MRHIVWWMRSAFCKHEWEFEQTEMDVVNEFGRVMATNTRESAVCNKCGWHRSYWKWGI